MKGCGFMLSKNEREIFRLAKDSKENKIKYSKAQELLNLSFDDVKSACKSLISKNLAEEKHYSPHPGSWIPWGIVLSERGRHRIRYAIEDFISFLFKSILVPIVVAFITTLFTIWLNGYFD